MAAGAPQAGGWFIDDLPSSDTQEVIVKIDSRGRISIPTFLRKNFYLLGGSKVRLRFNWKYNQILIDFRYKNGQSGVNGNIEPCGGSVLGSNPGSGPEKSRGDGYG